MSTLAVFMIVASANNLENGPLVWPTVEQEDGTVRLKTYEELSDKEKLQSDCDLKATNIVLQGLPPDVYALFNHHKIAKYVWDRVKLLMQGTSLSRKERKCNMYDEIDKFSHVKVKFLNSLLPEWGKFVTDVKLARDLHTSNYDQLYAYLEQHEFPQLDLGLAVSTFLPSDDPIACMNKAIAFLSAVFTPLYPSTNNQIRSSSNLRNQATVQDGRVTIQQAEGKELDEEQLAFLADPIVADGQIAQIITHNSAFQTDDLDAYDSDYDDISSAKVVLMANLSSFDSDVLSEIKSSCLLMMILSNTYLLLVTCDSDESLEFICLCAFLINLQSPYSASLISFLDLEDTSFL
ncbi:hypothetical protein Tco_0599393 [Tanacetum coccineum]